MNWGVNSSSMRLEVYDFESRFFRYLRSPNPTTRLIKKRPVYQYSLIWQPALFGSSVNWFHVRVSWQICFIWRSLYSCNSKNQIAGTTEPMGGSSQVFWLDLSLCLLPRYKAIQGEMNLYSWPPRIAIVNSPSPNNIITGPIIKLVFLFLSKKNVLVYFGLI